MDGQKGRLTEQKYIYNIRETNCRFRTIFRIIKKLIKLLIIEKAVLKFGIVHVNVRFLYQTIHSTRKTLLRKKSHFLFLQRLDSTIFKS